MAVGYLLLLVSWAGATPPLSGPDEWAHYYRALGVGAGSLIGEPVERFESEAEFTPEQRHYLDQTTRAVPVPAGLGHVGSGCNAFQPRVSARCLDRELRGVAEPQVVQTVVGVYPPFFYGLPGAVMHAASEPLSAVYVGRLVALLLTGGMLALAVVLAWGRGQEPWLLAGPLVASTPMVLSLGSLLNPSGLEVSSAVAFCAALVRLGVDERPGRAAWVGAGVAGLLLGLVRPLGLGWVVLHAGVALVLFGGEVWRERVRASPGAAALALGGVLVGCVGNRVWDMAYGPRVPLVFRHSWGAVREALGLLPGWLREQAGVFQYLDTPMQPIAYWLWAVALGVLLAGALWRTRPRYALVTGVCLAGVLLFAPVLYLCVVQPSGFPLQGRYVLPLSVGLPVFAAVAWAGSRASEAWRRFVLLFVGLATSTTHFLGWYANARRSAVGTGGPWHFLPRAEWAPWTGWWPLLVLALVGSALLVVGLALACARGPHERQGTSASRLATSARQRASSKPARA